MANELAFFDALIDTPTPLAGLREALKDYKGSLVRFQAEATAANNRIINHVHNTQGLEERREFVQWHQARLITLANIIVCHMDSKDVENIYDTTAAASLPNICKHTYKILEDMLSFMGTFLSKFFSTAARVPDAHRIIISREMKEKLDFITDVAIKHGVPPRLPKVIGYQYDKFFKGKKTEDCTYAKLEYLRNILEELVDVAHEATPGQDLEVVLIKKLTYLNFNSLTYLNYCTDRWTEKIEQTDSLHDRFEKLHWLINKNRHFHSRDAYELHPNRTTVKQLLRDWLTDELGFLTVKANNDKEYLIPQPDQDKFFLTLGTSVTKFAYFFRLMLDVSLLTSTNRAALLDNIGSRILTAKNEPISITAFKNRHYSPDRSTAVAVREILHEMIAISKKELP